MLAGEAEALHQMRIGLRRFRAAIALFAKMTADGEQERIKAELKWITNELGPARDLDVFTAEILKPLAKDGGYEDAGRAFAEARAKAYAAATVAIRSDRFRNALLDVAEWIEVGPWTVDEELAKLRERKIGKHAAKRLARLRSDVRDKGEDLRKLSAKKRHKLRIKAKTLRYARGILRQPLSGGGDRQAAGSGPLCLEGHAGRAWRSQRHRPAPGLGERHACRRCSGAWREGGKAPRGRRGRG